MLHKTPLSYLLIAAGIISCGIINADTTTLPEQCTAACCKKTQTSSRVDSLLSVMTVEEKIGQLHQLSGTGYSDEMVGLIRSGQVGSILNEVDPATVNRLQHEAVENSRLGIPLIIARDVIHGFRTIFPIPLGQAATWDENLVKEGARIAAEEASSVGVRWTFSPMVDIARDARWGRIAEGFGEDPLLTSRLGVAMVEGYQGNNLSSPNTMAACTKHFAGYGAAEGGRDYNTTWIPEQLLHDVYLPPFKACADAGAATFMCSFNDINGVPSSGNRHLMQDVLRDSWNWDGLIVSDWNSIGEMVNHGYSVNLGDAARQGALTGIDIDMQAYAYTKYLKDLVEKGDVPMERIDTMVRNVLKLKEKLGLFDNPYVDMANSAHFQTPEYLQAARHSAAQSAILLKNNNLLPLVDNIGKIAVSGPMADAQHDQNGTWCFDLDKATTITPLSSLREKYGDKNVIDARGLTYSRDRNQKNINRALKGAKKCDLILYFAGEEAVLSGEAHCRTDLTLPGAQSQEIEALKKLGKPIIIVFMAGRPLDISAQQPLADAMIYYFHPGTMGGPAIVDVLCGDVNPGGHLPVCLPRSSGQMPLYYAHKNTGRPAEDITWIDEIPLEAGQTSTGCTSFYLDAGVDPLYPFGYGLSYTDFSYSEPRLSQTTLSGDEKITVTCTVTNTGNHAGYALPQLYVRDMVGSLARPVRELKDFAKIWLKPGESADVVFELNADKLKFHNRNMEFVAEPGDFKLWVSPDSESGTPVTFKLN